ncbi:hypothetical protein FLAVO9R_50058 [Flavobacterium sp. 9R]|uniref:hypothetical protein n=1 Tax=Flavobacterium sp. 9R TaxID=2653143 RepID=UPI0012F116AD|nr:hypothetical protein [Flavobacterium sp. 9R]VXC00992.1 hypothetical protein FLAVO9R_50058 [Flavobacterium sp. 9R]
MSHFTKKHELLGILYDDSMEEGVRINRMRPTEIAQRMKITVLTASILIIFLKSRNHLRTSLIDVDNNGIEYNTLYEITPDGMIAHSFGYYRSEWINYIKENIKDVFTVLTPILSLVVAIVAIVFSNNDELEKKVDTIYEKIQKIESINVAKKNDNVKYQNIKK